MPYEYYLEPTDKNKEFPQQLIENIHDYIDRLPSYAFDKHTYILFKNIETRDRRVPLILADLTRNHYLDSSITIYTKGIILSSVMSPDVDRFLYEFVVWCQRHWDCKLYYGSEVVFAEELITEA